MLRNANQCGGPAILSNFNAKKPKETGKEKKLAKSPKKKVSLRAATAYGRQQKIRINNFIIKLTI